MSALATLRDDVAQGVRAKSDRALFAFQCYERVHLRGPQGWNGASQ